MCIVARASPGAGHVARHSGVCGAPHARKQRPMKFLLTSARLPQFGRWDYRPLTVEEARQWLLPPLHDECASCWIAGPATTGESWHSTIDALETALALE